MKRVLHDATRHVSGKELRTIRNQMPRRSTRPGRRVPSAAASAQQDHAGAKSRVHMQSRQRTTVDKVMQHFLFTGFAGLTALGTSVTLAAADERSTPGARRGDGGEGFVLEGIATHDYAGLPVRSAGDLNGDGIDDLFIGAHNASPNGRERAGEAFVVFGRTTPFPATFDLRRLFPAGGGDGSRGFVLKGIDPFDRTGQAGALAGDVNGDGVDDLVIGAFFASPNGARYAGESYVVFGRTTSFPPAFQLSRLLPDGGGDGSAGFVLEGVDDGDNSGRAVSAAGDLNGDGIDDLVVGAYRAGHDGHPSAGESYVVFGRATRFPPAFALGDLLPQNGGDGTAGFIIDGIDSGDFSGFAVSSAGDVNGDGLDDLIIGAQYADPEGRERAGEGYVVFGRSVGFAATFELRDLFPENGGDGSEGFALAGIDAGDNAGRAVAAAGDINGDGFDDLAVGAQYADPDGRDRAGESYVVFGRATAFPPVFQLSVLLPSGGGDGSAGFVVAGIDPGDGAGRSVGSAGDVNADGIDDLFVGAFGADVNGQTNSGEAYVIYGRVTGFPAVFQLSSLLSP